MTEKPKKVRKRPVPKTGWKKGQSGNPSGRPKKGEAFAEELLQMVKVVERRKRKKLMEHFVERAYADDKVLVALMRKFLPDATTLTVEGGQIPLKIEVVNYASA